MSKAVVLAGKLMGDAVVASSACLSSIIDPRIDELTGQLASTRVAVVSLMAKLSKLEDARDKTEWEHYDLV